MQRQMYVQHNSTFLLRLVQTFTYHKLEQGLYAPMFWIKNKQSGLKWHKKKLKTWDQFIVVVPVCLTFKIVIFPAINNYEKDALTLQF